MAAAGNKRAGRIAQASRTDRQRRDMAAPFRSTVEEKAIEIEIVVPKVIIKNAIIEMQLADWCGPCKRLKASGAIQELEKQGWTIVYTDGIANSYPSFRVWVDGESKVFTGYSKKSSFFTRIKSIVKDLKD